jgi:hypothetical protein
MIKDKDKDGKEREVEKSKADLYSIMIEFMGSTARSILRSIKLKDRSGAIDYRLVTAHLDSGMWWRYPNDGPFFNKEIDLAEQRFQLYHLGNFKYILHEK